MANKKLNDLETTEIFDHAYVEKESNQFRITKEKLGRELTKEVHLEFNTITSTPNYIFVQDTSNNYSKISLSDLAKAIRNDETSLGGDQPGNKMIYDGCFIMYHDFLKDNWPKTATYAEWPALQDAGQEADGVLIIDGGHFLLVAPKEQACAWSSKDGLASSPDEVQNYGRANRLTMLNTWNGQERTNTICTSTGSDFFTEGTTSDYAPGYCYNYTPHKQNPRTLQTKPGLRPHQYWLPCVAELMLIRAHKDKINAGLTLIYDADELKDQDYWTSIEDGESKAWYVNLKNGYIRGLKSKTSFDASTGPFARPVSTFAQSSLVGAA